MLRHWSILHDTLDEGVFDREQVHALLAPTGADAVSYCVDGRRVVVLDHTSFPRPSARTEAERERYPVPDGTRALGHRYCRLSRLVA